MAKVSAVCKHNGGVGKPPTAVNLAAYLATMGRRSLIVDFDPQANATSALGMSPLSLQKSIYHGIIGQATHQELMQTSDVRNLHFIPAAPHLAGVLVELVNVPEREYFLRKFLTPIRHYYDYMFVDLPPSMSLLTVNGMMAADEVLIPVQAEYYSLEGIGQLLETIGLIRQNLRHDLKVRGALLTMYNKQEKLSREVAKNLRTNFPHPVFEVEIPRNVALAEAPSFAKPIVLYRPDSPGALAYRRLAEEFIRGDREALALSGGAGLLGFGNFNVAVSE